MLSNDATHPVPPNVHRLALSSTHHCAVAMKERSATDTEVSRPLSSHRLGLGVRLLTPSQPIGFLEKAAHASEAIGAIKEIVPVVGSAPVVTDV